MSKYKGKKVLIVGFGTTGVAAARFMVKQGAQVTVTDLKQKADLRDSFKGVGDLKIEYDLGKNSSKAFSNSDLILVSPGVPLNIPGLDEARAKSIPITNDVEIAATMLKQPLIGVTGTNGKTTTTTLIGEMFAADQKAAFVCGNIGRSPLDLFTDNLKADFVVAELSSFQLELLDKAALSVAVFTNFEQDHLDRYKSLDAYLDAKRRLFKLCNKNSYVVLNYDDPYVSRLASEVSGKLIWFTKRDPMTIGGDFAERFTGVYYSPETLEIVSKLFSKEERYNVSKLRIFGDHNKENLMAAICAARMSGVSAKAIQSVIENFRGVPHRLEFIRKKDGVFFFNDSKATNAMSVQRSLSAFRKNPIILIAGGKDKDIDFTPLAELVRKRCKILILLGEAKEKINRAIGDYAETYLVGTFEEAVLLAYQKSRSGDIILLSPGCASFDMFRNYEERGDYFKRLILQL